jgi:hypothetical protein
MIGKIWKKSKLNSERICKMWKKAKLNSKKIWKIQMHIPNQTLGAKHTFLSQTELTRTGIISNSYNEMFEA